MELIVFFLSRFSFNVSRMIWNWREREEGVAVEDEEEEEEGW